MEQIPGSLVSADAEIALELLCREALLGIQYECDRVEPNYQRKVSILKKRATGRGKLLMAGRFKAEVKPFANILGSALALNLGNLIGTTYGATDYAIRPAHFLDVLKAFLICGK